MRNEENIGDIVRDKRTITSLALTYKICTICYVIIYQGKYKGAKEQNSVFNSIKVYF